jgi:hypothetical protein
MAKKILVPLRRSDRLDSLLPYLEKIAQPGMQVVFFVHYRISDFNPLMRQLLAFHAGIFSPAKSSKETWHTETSPTEEEIRSACRALITRGVKPDTVLYKARVSRVIREYMRNGDVHLVVMQSTAGNAARNFYARLGA